MDVREKLVEIVKKAAYSSLPSNTEDFHLNMFVTNLLSHGVTVQEQKSPCSLGYMIRNRPTIDAVPVVRCRECKHRYTEKCPMYFHDSYWHEGYEEYVDDDTDHTEDDYFCPKGERKEGADNEAD